MPFNIGPGELILILVIALVVLGPGKLPDVASSLGKSVREFRKAATDVTEAGRLDEKATSSTAQATPSTAAAPAAPPSPPMAGTDPEAAAPEVPAPPPSAPTASGTAPAPGAPARDPNAS